MINEYSTVFQIPELYYKILFEALPGYNVLVKTDEPKFTILAATPGYLYQTGYTKEALTGKGIFEAFPGNNTDPSDTGKTDLYASYQHVLRHKEAHFLPVQRYDLLNADGSFSEKYWRASNTPVLSPEGDVVYIIHTAEDITHEVLFRAREEKIKGMEVVNNLFNQAPLPICLLKGPDLAVEIANEPTLQLWGRNKEVIGLPLEQAVPEVRGQGYAEMINEVRETGIAKQIYESPVSLLKNGREEISYINYVYHPYYEEDRTRAAGVLAIGSDVTDKVLAKKQVQASEAKYRTLFESMDQGFCVLEVIFDANNKPVDYRFLEANPVFERQTGLRDAVGKTARELVPDLEEYWFDLYGKVALSGEAVHFTERSKAMKRWFEVFAFPIEDIEVHKVALLFTDITQRRTTEEAIRQSEANLLNVILQAPVAMAILKGPRFVVELANDRMYELWGRGKEELLGKSIFEGLPEVRNQGYEGLLTNVYTTGERFTALGIPVTLPRKDTIETVYINLLYEAFRETDGTISGVMAVAMDVTEQVRARIKVEESQKEFQFVTDFMPQMIWVTRPDGYHYYYNKQWYDYTGLTFEETKGDGWNSVFHPDDQQRAWKVWRHSLKTGEPYEIEYRGRRHDGEYRWFLGRALPLKDEEGRITKWFGTCTDIDDQKKAAEIMERRIQERTEELQKSNQELSRSNVNLEEFAYAASHDLKEPMRKIQMFSGRLTDRLLDRLDEEEKGYLNRIMKATDRMNTLIDDLLMYSHVSRGAVLEESIDLNKKVQSVLEDLELEIEEKKATIQVGQLPTFKGNRRQLQQLFQNLIGNAIKYHRPGVDPVVNISCQVTDGNDQMHPLLTKAEGQQFYLIEVSDNGIGFEPEDADRIFNVFTRLHGNAEYKGTGVGLSIARKVVENHGGYIWATSKPGDGATFKVLLPAG
jgi:hypothetical protein